MQCNLGNTQLKLSTVIKYKWNIFKITMILS